jgi:hypothetical protein
MNLSGLHLLLTYQCTLECEHCFVWGSPWQRGVMTQADIQNFLGQAEEQGSIAGIAFEGGEPFLYYATLLAGVQEAARRGFTTQIVTNAFWATSREDALAALRPFAGTLGKLSVSSDRLHWRNPLARQAEHAEAAAAELGIPTGMLRTAHPRRDPADTAEGGVMFRGRAAAKLVQYAPLQPWEEFAACPHENLRDPGRVHLDPSGNLHICQGLCIGNLFQTPLKQICASFDPERHPVLAPLLRGGPAGLAREYDLPHGAAYADACHLCYEARDRLRARFPAELAPDQMYGV